MSINIEKLYTNACEVLRNACIHLQGERDGLSFYEKVTKDPELWLKSAYIGDVTAALEIWVMAKEEISKSKGGSAYTILKKFIKGIPDYRRDLCGAWLDSDGRQCVCDGYRAVRLNVPVDGFETVKGFELDKVFPQDHELVQELPMPTPGELKINKRKLDSYRGAATVYDFGDNLPLVNADYLKHIMDCLPDAKAYVTDHPLTGPIIFKSDKGDALLLPVRKKTA